MLNLFGSKRGERGFLCLCGALRGSGGFVPFVRNNVDLDLKAERFFKCTGQDTQVFFFDNVFLERRGDAKVCDPVLKGDGLNTGNPQFIGYLGNLSFAVLAD